MKVYRLTWTDGTSTVLVVHYDNKTISKMSITGETDRVTILRGISALDEFETQIARLVRRTEAELQTRES